MTPSRLLAATLSLLTAQSVIRSKADAYKIGHELRAHHVIDFQ